MSPRAACRLEQQLGFAEVYDYTAGKVDWLAPGLDTEGTACSVRTVGSPASVAARRRPTSVPSAAMEAGPSRCGPTVGLRSSSS